MKPEQFETLELCDLKLPSVPPRSRLYSLEPVQMNTYYVESLTSYITRLAFNHSLRTGVLVEKEFSCLINKKYGISNLRLITHASKAFNGMGEMAQELVSVVSHLTRRENLRFLTLLPWSGILTSRNLLRPIRAWCPLCYQEWSNNQQIIYEPLLWALIAINICPVHKAPLVSQCPYCHRNNLILTGCSQPGYCFRCGAWLGIRNENNNIQEKSVIPINLEWETWKTSNVGELLAELTSLVTLPSREIISQNLITYAQKITQGNLAVLARKLQIPKNTFWSWCQGKNQPTLEALLKISYCLKISLYDFITADAINNNKGVVHFINHSNTQRATRKSFPAEQIKQSLEEILNSNDNLPLSMKEVAKILNFDRRTIFTHFPDLCKAISAKYAEYQQFLFEQKIEKSCQEVEQAVTKLYQVGEYPTEVKVSKLISSPGFLRYRKVRGTFNKARSLLF